MFVLVRMQVRNHVHTPLVKRCKRSKFYATLYSQISYEIWNVASARERGFTAQMV